MALLAIYLGYLTLQRLIHLRIFMLKIRNYYTTIVKALEQVPYSH